MPSSVVKSFADKTGKSVAEVEKLWDKAKAIVKDEYKDVPEDSDKFYSLVTGILKKMLKIDEQSMAAVTTTSANIGTGQSGQFKKRMTFSDMYRKRKKRKEEWED